MNASRSPRGVRRRGRPAGGGGQAKVLTPAEITRVDKCLNGMRNEHRNRALFYLQLATGVRGGELASLPSTASRRSHQKTRVPSHKLHAYLQEQHATALPESPLGTAVGYALRNWVALTRYTEDGRLKIDNNGAEQALRPIVCP
jgi:transposase